MCLWPGPTLSFWDVLMKMGVGSSRGWAIGASNIFGSLLIGCGEGGFDGFACGISRRRTGSGGSASGGGLFAVRKNDSEAELALLGFFYVHAST